MSSTADVITTWKPARMFPETYPGNYPKGHYLYFRDAILPIAESTFGDGYDVVADGERTPLDQFLTKAGASPLADRIPVLAYGANRNPATIGVKLLNYHYAATSGPCIPVLTATLAHADVVACRLHGQGYLYGELLMGSPLVADTRIDVHVLLVDPEGLRVLNESESVAEGVYSVAHVPDVRVSGLSRAIAPLGYVANAPVWSSPALSLPLAFSSITATSRTLPAMTPREMLDHALDALDLRAHIAAVTGLPEPDLARNLAKFLNGQWWYVFNTRDEPIPGYTQALAAMSEAMERTTLMTRTYDYLRDNGCVLDAEALRPGAASALPGLTLEAMLDEGR